MPASPDYRLLRRPQRQRSAHGDLQRGIDRTLTEPERLEMHFADVAFGLLPGVPDADGQPANGSDGVRLGPRSCCRGCDRSPSLTRYGS